MENRQPLKKSNNLKEEEEPLNRNKVINKLNSENPNPKKDENKMNKSQGISNKDNSSLKNFTTLPENDKNNQSKNKEEKNEKTPEKVEKIESNLKEQNNNGNNRNLEKNQEINQKNNNDNNRNLENNQEINRNNNEINNNNRNIEQNNNLNNKYTIISIIIVILGIIIYKFIHSNDIIIEQTTKTSPKIEKSESENTNKFEEIEEPEFLFSKDDKKLKKLNKTIIGIDFGSSYSGFSVGIDSDTIETRYENIEPTIIVMESDTLIGYKYGTDADKFMNNERNSKYIYFDRIKTKLDPKYANEHQENIYITANFPENKGVKLKNVITEYLRLFSNNALEYINLKGNKYTKDDIKWVVTVPAIWNEYGKQFMVDCAKRAGMDDISIALEPEAASLTMFNDNIIDEKYKKKGKTFMLVDAGGYTIDITLNEIIDNNGNLKQISPPSGGAFGSININQDLIKLVEEVFGYNLINNLKKNKYDRWKMTLDSIENKKKEIRDDGSDADYFKIDTRFDETTCNSYNEKCASETSFGKIEYDNNVLYIPKNVMKKIIMKNVKPTIDHIKKLIKKYKNIDLIVLTGGFSNCKILIEEFKKNFRRIDYKILSRPETSVMNGAVIYGIKPNKIVSRKMPYTVGLSTYSFQKENTVCKNKIQYNKEILCEYFSIFKRVGDDIKNNDFVENYYYPVYKDQTSVLFQLYYSKSLDPIYVDDENNFLIADFGLEMRETHLPIKERKAKVKMEFGSCISVTAKNVISGKEVKITANYYNRND